MRWRSGVGATSARTSGAERALRRQQPAHERVDRAHADGAAGPRRSRRVLVGDPVHDEVDEVVGTCAACSPSIDQAPSSPAGLPSRVSLAGDVVHHHRVLLALVLGVGEDERQQLARRRTPRSSRRTRARRWCGWRRRAPALGSPAPGRGEAPRRSAKGPAGRPSRRVAVAARSSVRRRVRLVEEQQVLALHVEDERLGVDGLGAEHARVEQAVEQEGGVARLRGDAGDAARC